MVAPNLLWCVHNGTWRNSQSLWALSGPAWSYLGVFSTLCALQERVAVSLWLRNDADARAQGLLKEHIMNPTSLTSNECFAVVVS